MPECINGHSWPTAEEARMCCSDDFRRFYCRETGRLEWYHTKHQQTEHGRFSFFERVTNTKAESGKQTAERGLL